MRRNSPSHCWSMSWMYFDQKQLNKNADASADCTNKKNKKNNPEIICNDTHARLQY